METKFEPIITIVCKKCNSEEVVITVLRRRRFNVVLKKGGIQWAEGKYYEFIGGPSMPDLITRIECLRCGETADEETIEEMFEIYK